MFVTVSPVITTDPPPITSTPYICAPQSATWNGPSSVRFEIATFVFAPQMSTIGMGVCKLSAVNCGGSCEPLNVGKTAGAWIAAPGSPVKVSDLVITTGAAYGLTALQTKTVPPAGAASTAACTDV